VRGGSAAGEGRVDKVELRAQCHRSRAVGGSDESKHTVVAAVAGYRQG
jgi:hypothetical protein